MNDESLCFAFGDPIPSLLPVGVDYLGVMINSENDYYTPPVDLAGIAKLRFANAHHASALIFKANALTRYFMPNRYVSVSEFSKMAYEAVLFGQVYCHHRKSIAGGKTLRLESLPGLRMRKLRNANAYCAVKRNNEIRPFGEGEVLHIKSYDPEQSIYGLPEYLGAMQSILLNEDATLLRRRYYLNGAHLGYILYVAGSLEKEMLNAIESAVKESKGIGNGSSMFINLPKGAKDNVQILPVGDIGTKDDFEKIKNISRNDTLAMHRIPPALAGIMPENVSGFGDVEKANRVYYENEIKPLQSFMQQLNQFLPSSAKIQFSSPDMKE